MKCRHNVLFLLPEQQAKILLKKQNKKINDKTIGSKVLENSIYGLFAYCNKCNDFIDISKSSCKEKYAQKCSIVINSDEYKTQIKYWIDKIDNGIETECKLGIFINN